MTSSLYFLTTAAVLLFQGTQSDPHPKSKNGQVVSSITIDGSSTVNPVTNAIVMLFSRQNPGQAVDATAHGSGSGFSRFVNGEINIAQASRPISAAESAKAKAKGIEFHEITVGFDGITLVVHPENTFVSDLTLQELKMIWSSGSKVLRWNDIRPSWPSTPVKLYGPGGNHGTTDFFSYAVTGKEKQLRTDYNVVPDDDYAVLVDAIANDRNAFGFITYAYYVRNFKRVKAVGIGKNGESVLPTYANIVNESYAPFSRSLYLYVAKNELHRPEMETFLDFYLNVAPAIVKKVGYVPLNRESYSDQKDQLNAVIRQIRGEQVQLTK